MSEKRGDIGKLEYDFPTHGLLEIFMNEKWYRVTGRDFRSFDGPRRISLPIDVQLGNVDIPLETVDYHGPVYLWGMNTIVPYEGSGTIIDSKVRRAGLKGSADRR